MIERRKFMERVAVMLAALQLFEGLHIGGVTQTGDEEERNQIWKTRDGQEIRVRDLSDDHLRNIIFFLNKRFAEILAADVFMQMPADFDNYVYEKRMMYYNPATMWPIYDVLRREATRRKLAWI